MSPLRGAVYAGLCRSVPLARLHRVARTLPRPESEVAPDISGATSDFGRAKDEATVGDRRQATGDTAGGDLCKVHSTSETTRNYPIALSIDDAIADLNVWVSELDKCVP